MGRPYRSTRGAVKDSPVRFVPTPSCRHLTFLHLLGAWVLWAILFGPTSPFGGTALSLAASETAHQPESEPEGLKASLVYVSDYFSFVGEDAQGHVAFALDSNRGRDGETYQAEHFVVLHDEGHGWVNVLGNGRYPTLIKDLTIIPPSPSFKFHGAPSTGLDIISEPNHLVLRIEPVTVALSRHHNHARYAMGSAAGVLEWAGRTIKGRVIHEYLIMPDFNRLTRTYWGLWKEYQGLYLTIGGEEKVGDLYVHSQKSEMIIPLVGQLAGFAVLEGQADPLEGLTLTPMTRTMALGFYRWPIEWRLEWVRGNTPVSTRLTLSDRQVIGNWVIGGFAMGIVKGEMTLNGRTMPIYGLAELIL